MGRDPQATAFDLIKAREFAAKAGAKMPKRLNLMLLWSPRPYIPNPRRAAELIRDQLAEIGIAIDFVVPADRNEYFDRIRRGNYDLVMGGWIAVRILVEQAPLVPLIYGQAVAVYSRNVQGFRASPLGRVSLASLQMR